MSPSTPAAKRSTQLLVTPTVLGKRVARETPTLTPNAMVKRRRLANQSRMGEGNSDVGNTPPSPSTDGKVDTPTKAPSTRKRLEHQPPSPSQAIAAPQARASRIEIPQTPATSSDQLYLNTPPPTPTTTRCLHARIRSLFRVTSNSSQCMSMNGRENEQQIIESFLRSINADPPEIAQPVLYISGSPGTGKSALVDSILASTPKSNNTRVITMNCMAFNNVDTIWEYLGEELYGPIRKGGSKTKKVCYNKDTMTKLLEKEKSLKCIAILDEIDHLSSFNSLQSLIHLAVRLPQTLRLIGIANTHTLSSTSTLLPFALESSAEHIKTIHFAPYTSAQLLSIIQKRLESIPQDELKRTLPVSTLTLLTKKVAAVTGDVRVLFQVLRGAIDNAVSSMAMEGKEQTLEKRAVTVTPAHILTALKPHTSATSASPMKSSISETVTKVGNLGLHGRLVLLSLLVASKRLAQTLSLSLSASSALPSPTKHAPTKRSRTSASTTSASNKPIASPPAKSIDASKLHSLYTAILDSADMFKPLTRSEFSDSLGLLESSGLVSLSAGSNSGSRTFRRASSFKGKMRGGGVAGGAAQCVRLQNGIRKKELARGLGIVVDAEAPSPTRVENSKVDVREEDVRTIWNREMVRIRKEVKARDFASGEAHGEVELGFEDAMED